MAYVYKCTNKINGIFYIGSRWKNELTPSEDLGYKYFTSSKVINKTNISEYAIEILKEFESAAEAWDYEQILIRDNFADPLIINQFFLIGGKKQFRNIGGYNLSEETKAKQRKPKSEQGRKNIGDANRLRLAKEDERAKLRKPKSEETRQRMKIAQKLKGGPTKETSKKISDTNKAKGIKPPNQKDMIWINNKIINKKLSKFEAMPSGGLLGV